VRNHSLTDPSAAAAAAVVGAVAPHNTAATADDALHNTVAVAIAAVAVATSDVVSSPINEVQSHEYTN